MGTKHAADSKGESFLIFFEATGDIDAKEISRSIQLTSAGKCQLSGHLALEGRGEALRSEVRTGSGNIPGVREKCVAGDAAGKKGVADFAHSPSLPPSFPPSRSIFANGKLKRGKILGQGEPRCSTGDDVGVRERQRQPRGAATLPRPPPRHSIKVV